jgi:hypothetical protein
MIHGAAFEKKIYRLIIEGKRKKCSLLKNKSRTKIFCCRFVKKLAEKHDFRTRGVIGQEIKFLVLDIKNKTEKIK